MWGRGSWPTGLEGRPRQAARRASWTPQTHSGTTPEDDEAITSSGGRRSFAALFFSFGKAGKRVPLTKEVATSDAAHRKVSDSARPQSQFYVDLHSGRTLPDVAHSESHAHCGPAETHHSQTEDVGWGATGVGQEAVASTCRQEESPPPAAHGARPKCVGGGVLVLPEAVFQSTMYRRRAAAAGQQQPDGCQPRQEAEVLQQPDGHINTHTVPATVTQQYVNVVAQLAHTGFTSLRSSVGQGPAHSPPGHAMHAALNHCGGGGGDGAGGGEAAVGGRGAGSMSSVVLCDTTNPLTLSPDWTRHDKGDRKVFLIANEVVTSERVFVNVLKLLNVDFRQFILEWREGGAAALPQQQLDKILNYLPQLQNLNEEILKDLEERIADWDRQRKISDVIVRKGPFLKLYSAYIKEFQNQCDYLDHCCLTRPLFSRALRQFEESEQCHKLSLKHYMLKPVQRLPQYRLLLEEYLKRLPETSPDYLDTHTALAVVANVASHANNTMKQGTNFMKLLALQDRLSSSHSSSTGDHDNSNSRRPRYELIRPGRYLMKEGELLKLCRREMQPRYFILLSDVLLYTSFVTSGPGGALRLNCELTLEGMKVETPKAEDFKNEFNVISTSRSFTLQASTAEERNEWIKALREAIEDNASRRSTFLQAKMPNYQQPSTSTLGKQAPVWIPDYRVTMCQQCTAEFTLTFRRHHCRACGKVVCDHCSANRAPLQYKKNQVARVCDGCFEILQKDFENRYEGSVNLEDQQGSRMRRVSSLKAQFKKGIRDSNRYRTRKRVPERLMEVSASDTSSQMCGYLRMLVRRSWHRGWFVLKDRVLYEYRAPQDVCALQSIPVLGYQVQTMQEVRELADGVDACLVFQLTHPNQQPLVFHADSPHLAEKWIQAMKEAVILT